MEKYPPPPIQQQQQQQQQPNYPPPPSQQSYYPPPPQPQQNWQTPPAQPSYYPPQGYAPNPGQAEYAHPEGENKIRPAKGWNDVWATILWLCNLAAFIVVSVFSLRTFQGNQGSLNGGTTSSTQYSGIVFDTSTFKIWGLAVVIGFGISFLYLLLTNAFPRFMIIATFIGSIIVYFGVTIYYFTQHYYSAAIVFLIFSVLYLLAFWWWRSRIPLATVLLETVTTLAKKYPSTIVIGLVSLVIQTAFTIWFSLTVVGAYQTWFSSTPNNARLNLAMVFLVFSFYWTSQVISYVTHVTLAGIFASLYFLGNRVASPVWGSLKRALTTSFGSICFGSLLIALVNLLRYFIQIARSSTDNAILGFFLCIVDCIIGCFQGLFEWFNYYAFSGVAIYGKPFVASARETWNLMKDRGIDALINDNLVGNVLFMGGLFSGVLCSLFGFIYLQVFRPAYNQGGNMTPVVILVCFLIGSSMFSSIATVISSGVATLFVCLGEDPDALRRTSPALFEKIRQTYPRVVQGV